MRHQVEHARHVRTHSDRRDHETELGNGGISQHFLDVILTDGNRRGKERRDCAGHRNNILRLRNERIKRSRARHEIHTRSHHRRGMDQRRNGSRAGHRIRQPNVKRNLRRLTRHTDQHEERDGHDHPGLDCCQLQARLRRPASNWKEPRYQNIRKPAIRKPKSPTRLVMKAFLAALELAHEGRAERVHVVPETDQQEGAKPHAFPADEEHHVRVAADEDHHRGDEQVQEDEEAADSVPRRS